MQVEAREVERALEVGQESAHLDLRQPRRGEPEHVQLLSRHTVAAQEGAKRVLGTRGDHDV